jgi:hypothetical protein
MAGRRHPPRPQPIPSQQSVLVLRKAGQLDEKDPFLGPADFRGDGQHLRGSIAWFVAWAGIFPGIPAGLGCLQHDPGRVRSSSRTAARTGTEAGMSAGRWAAIHWTMSVTRASSASCDMHRGRPSHPACWIPAPQPARCRSPSCVRCWTACGLLVGGSRLPQESARRRHPPGGGCAGALHSVRGTGMRRCPVLHCEHSRGVTCSLSFNQDRTKLPPASRHRSQGSQGHPHAIIPSTYQSAENMLRDTRPFWTRKITDVQFLAF